MPKALKLRERVSAMANPHKSERILFQLFSNSVIVIVIVIVARMRVSRVGVKQKIISPERSELKNFTGTGMRHRFFKRIPGEAILTFRELFFDVARERRLAGTGFLI